MIDYILKRIGLMIITAFIIIIIVFVMVKLMPDIDKPMLGIDPKLAAMIKEREGYNKPIPEQFIIWLKNIILKGNFGYSESKKTDAFNVLITRIPVSVKVNIIPFLISIPIGFGLGIFAALRKNKLPDYVISLGVVFFISVPSFVVATLLQYFFGYKFKIFPALFAPKVDIASNPSLAITSMVLPVLAMTFGTVAAYTRYTRAELTEVLTSEFMLLCRTKGLSKTQATIRHALRNSMVPLVPMVIGGFISILSGSLIVEKIFRIEGIGGVYLEAFNSRDYSLVMLLIVFYLIVGLLSTLLIDISYSIVDPRIRLGGGKRA